MYVHITKHEVSSYNRCIVHAMHEMNQLGHGLGVTEAVCCHLNDLPCDLLGLLILYQKMYTRPLDRKLGRVCIYIHVVARAVANDFKSHAST